MGGADPVFRWHEPPAPPSRVVLLGTAAAGLLALAVVSLVVANYDIGVLAGVLGAAALADLGVALRARCFVLAGDDGVVVGRHGRTTVVPWPRVAGVRVQPRRFGRDRGVLERTDGTLVPLPSEVPLAEIERRRPRGATG